MGIINNALEQSVPFSRDHFLSLLHHSIAAEACFDKYLIDNRENSKMKSIFHRASFYLISWGPKNNMIVNDSFSVYNFTLFLNKLNFILKTSQQALFGKGLINWTQYILEVMD